MANLLRQNPRRLHDVVVQDPSTAARCFHYTVRLVIKTLFHCASPGQSYPDGLPTDAEPGILGHLAGYLGVVEPHMRKALHIHMLVQLRGFSHPRGLFADGAFVERFRTMWFFVASICFRSTEAFAHYTGGSEAFSALRQEPLLPITPKQRGMIGKERSDESIAAQLRARELIEVTQQSGPPRPPVNYVPDMNGDASVASSA